jgi:hypothetical protein
MATRRNIARTQAQSDKVIIGDTELLPALREYRTSDLRPSPGAHALGMLSLARDLGENEDPQAPAGRALQ